MRRIEDNFANGPLTCIDKWVEAMGPSVVVDWVRIFVAPLHAWRKEVMWKLGELIGAVEEVDARCLTMEMVEFVRVKVVRLAATEIPKTLSLDVGDLRYGLWTEVEPRKVV